MGRLIIGLAVYDILLQCRAAMIVVSLQAPGAYTNYGFFGVSGYRIGFEETLNHAV
jgi:hypothetical protein